jgi:sulfate/thiosulfate transport system substrate-binding protein
LKRIKVSTSAAAVALTALAAGCGGSGSSGSSSTTINLVAYSTPQAAYTKLIPAFQATAAGSGVQFLQSYGSSGDQSRAVVAGQKADVVHFSLLPDMERLVPGQVAATWNQGPDKGIVADSVVVFIVKPGNPKHITGWDDLVKSGVQVVTPNPFTSGGARWNVMAGYGAQIKEGKTPAQAQQFLYSLFRNVVVQDDKQSAALQTFLGGKGDVLLAPEQDALTAKAAGEPVQIVYPAQTILVQTPIAVTKTAPAAAKKFVSWLFSSQGQTIFAENGYRPVDPTVAAKFASKYPTPPTLFTIDDLGGWDSVAKTFFDPTTGLMAKVEQSIGVSTSG